MIDSLITIAVCISTALTILILLLPSQYVPKRSTEHDGPNEPKTTVQVLVLGDIGRSPRMQYHALSIAKGGGQVDIIGYHGTTKDDIVFTRPAANSPSRIRSSSRHFVRS